MESESDVCLVCLAPSTALYPLGEYSQLYKMLSEKEKSLDYTVMVSIFLNYKPYLS